MLTALILSPKFDIFIPVVAPCLSPPYELKLPFQIFQITQVSLIMFKPSPPLAPTLHVKSLYYIFKNSCVHLRHVVT